MVEDGDGELIVQSVFLDIDIRKRTEHQNQQLKELAEANSAIPEYGSGAHLSLRVLLLSGPAGPVSFRTGPAHRYQCGSRYVNMPDSFAQEMVVPGGRGFHPGMYEDIHSGKRTASAQFLTVKDSWCRVTMSAVEYGRKRTERNRSGNHRGHYKGTDHGFGFGGGQIQGFT